MEISITHIISAGGGEFFQVEAEIRNGENSETRAFRLLSSQYMKIRPVKGEITRDEFDELQNASEICKAYLRAVSILSFGANTAQTLVMKLRRRGFSSDVAEETVKLLIDKGYISEETDIRRDIERSLGKRWGSRRILAYLHQKGYDDDTLSLAEDALSSVDFDALCLDLLMSHTDELPSDPHERQKLIGFLSRYGYSMSEIRHAFAKFERGC